MRSASASLAASAHRVANLQTQGFKAQPVHQQSVAGGGSRAVLSESNAAGPVDLTREIVSQIESSTQYTASLRVLEVGADLRGQLLDVLA
jgi:flagellar hook protein FlgE